jgi:hypothetical protein
VNAIAKMEQLRELIWSRLTGKHPAAENAIEQAKAGEQAGVDTKPTAFPNNRQSYWIYLALHSQQ